MRGDNFIIYPYFYNIIGSPPHAWGQFKSYVRGNRLFRFTPTCVGTMIYIEALNTFTPVHPHMRGDNIMQVYLFQMYYGSPPHAWGQLIFQ